MGETLQIWPAALIDALAFAKSKDELLLVQRQIGEGRAWKARDSRLGLLALFGLYHTERKRQEAWFRATSGAGETMLKLVRAFRQLLRAHAYCEIRCLIKPGHAPGERLARLLHFKPTGERFAAPGAPVDGSQFWRYEI